MFFTDGFDVKIDFVLGLDRDVGTEGVPTRCARAVFRGIIEGKDFVSILLLLDPLQEIVPRLSTVAPLPSKRCGAT